MKFENNVCTNVHLTFCASALTFVSLNSRAVTMQVATTAETSSLQRLEVLLCMKAQMRIEGTLLLFLVACACIVSIKGSIEFHRPDVGVFSLPILTVNVRH